MINSVKCMYLDDAPVAISSGTTQRFKAIRKGTPMHALWMNNVRALFESGQWDRIDYRDVIKGDEIDQALHDVLSNRGTTPDQFFNMDKSAQHGQGRKSMGLAQEAPSVLGDAEPPDPPGTTDFEPPDRQKFAAPRRPGGKKSGGGAGLAVVAAAAVALVVMGKKG